MHRAYQRRMYIKEICEKHKGEANFKEQVKKGEYYIKVECHRRHLYADVIYGNINDSFVYEGDLREEYDDNYLKYIGPMDPFYD